MNATATDPIVALARHALEFSADQLDVATLPAARMIVTDTLAVGLAGSKASYAAQLHTVVHNWGSGGECRVLGSGRDLPAASAAFMNAYQIHGQEYDCVHEGAVVHPMAAIMAAALADIERISGGSADTGISGADFLAAISAAVDVAIAVGLSATAGLRFFRPATAGAFGAAAVVARLRGYSLDTTVQTFGHLYSQLCGTMQAHTEGAAVLPMQIGFNARNAIVAADLAAAQIGAPVNIIEGPFGYLELFEPDGSITACIEALAASRRIAELAYKPYPTGRATHAGLHGLLSLCRDHEIDSSQIASVSLIGPPLIHRLVARPIKPDLLANYARLCMQYTGAVALARNAVGLFDFDRDSLDDPGLHALASRIEVIDDASPDPNALAPQTVVIKLADGKVFQEQITSLFGSPKMPMTDRQHADKIAHCCEFAGYPQAADNITVTGTRLEQLADVGEWLAHAYAD